MVWCLNLRVTLKSIAEVHVTSGIKITSSFDKKIVKPSLQAKYKLNYSPPS